MVFMKKKRKANDAEGNYYRRDDEGSLLMLQIFFGEHIQYFFLPFIKFSLNFN